jgi:GxxExxY protein
MNTDKNAGRSNRKNHRVCNEGQQHPRSWLLEKVYENALMVELARAGLAVEQQKPIKVSYEGVLVGDFAADIIVNGSVVLELKAAKMIDEIHQAQLLNYLRATGLRVGLILNFGTPRLGIKRMVL